MAMISVTIPSKESMTKAGTTTELAINGTNVPSLTVPDLTTLPPDDLMAASKNVWMLGRSAHDAIVACFKEIMYRYDGRKSNCPTQATVQEAFASIGVNYEAARKLVYRDEKKRELEAIAASLHLPPAPTSTSTTAGAERAGRSARNQGPEPLGGESPFSGCGRASVRWPLSAPERLRVHTEPDRSLYRGDSLGKAGVVVSADILLRK